MVKESIKFTKFKEIGMKLSPSHSELSKTREMLSDCKYIWLCLDFANSMISVASLFLYGIKYTFSTDQYRHFRQTTAVIRAMPPILTLLDLKYWWHSRFSNSRIRKEWWFMRELSHYFSQNTITRIVGTSKRYHSQHKFVPFT